MIISAAAFVQKRLRVGREMTFSSIKSAAFLFLLGGNPSVLSLQHMLV